MSEPITANSILDFKELKSGTHLMKKQKLPIETYLKGDSWKKFLTLINRLKSLHHITYLNLIVTNSTTIVRTLDTLTVFIHFFPFSCLLVSF